VLKTQVVQQWKLCWKLMGECHIKLIFGVLIYSNTYRTLYAMTQLLLMSYDALVPHTNWSSSPDTLECPRSLGASSELSSAHALIVRTNWSSILDTLECLLTPGALSGQSSAQHNKRPHPHRAHKLVFRTGHTRVPSNSR
jgi:hypothetical protein